MFKLWWYELGNEKKCEIQHHLNVSVEHQFLRYF
jgi:hypothetical protein